MRIQQLDSTKLGASQSLRKPRDGSEQTLMSSFYTPAAYGGHHVIVQQPHALPRSTA